MWPIGSGQIHTSSHAGGIARATIRSITSGSVTRLPSSSRYSKPMPRRRRRSPGPEQSTFRSLATDPWSPARLALNLAASGEHVLEQPGHAQAVGERLGQGVGGGRHEPRVGGLDGEDLEPRVPRQPRERLPAQAGALADARGELLAAGELAYVAVHHVAHRGARGDRDR